MINLFLCSNIDSLTFTYVLYFVVKYFLAKIMCSAIIRFYIKKKNFTEKENIIVLALFSFNINIKQNPLFSLISHFPFKNDMKYTVISTILISCIENKHTLLFKESKLCQLAQIKKFCRIIANSNSY